MTIILSYIVIFAVIIICFVLIARAFIVAYTMFTDVPYLPSNNGFKRGIKYLDIKDGDNVLDIGSGDGKVLFYLSKKYPKAHFVGVETNRVLVLSSQFVAWLLRRKNLTFICEDIHNYNISKFNKIYLYLIPTFIDEIFLEKENELQSGCVVISFHFPMGHKFLDTHKVTQYPVKYMKENIYKWEK